MRLSEVVRGSEAEYGVRRESWEPGVAIYFENNEVWYRREPGAFGWQWSPKYEDLIADDWVPVVHFPCLNCTKYRDDHYIHGGRVGLLCYPNENSSTYEPATRGRSQ